MYPDWFQTFFNGLALDMWRAAIPPEQTAKETDFLAQKLAIQPGASVLDVLVAMAGTPRNWRPGMAPA